MGDIAESFDDMDLRYDDDIDSIPGMPDAIDIQLDHARILRDASLELDPQEALPVDVSPPHKPTHAHKTKDGKVTLLSQMEINHLKNTIAYMKRRAQEGVLMQYGGDHDADEMWYEEETVYGQKAEDCLKVYEYERELNLRKRKQ